MAVSTGNIEGLDDIEFPIYADEQVLRAGTCVPLSALETTSVCRSDAFFRTRAYTRFFSFDEASRMKFEKGVLTTFFDAFLESIDISCFNLNLGE